MKTHWKKTRNPNYFGSWDLCDKEGKYFDATVTITGTKKETVFDGKGGSEECTVVTFAECKPIVANATNLRSIARFTGSPFIEDWIGKQIVLTVQQVKAFGEVHDAIRVKKHTPKEKPPISAERFAKAVEAYQNGLTTKEDIIKNFTLTDEQLQTLNQSAPN